MAFCTSCGATVQGAFCQQCGTPASAPASQPVTSQPVTAQPVAYQPANPAAVPPALVGKGKVSPLVWILLAVVGIVVLGGIAVVSAGVYFVKNPGRVMATLITAGNPNVEVLSTDMGSKTLHIRDKKTGEEVTVSFDDVKNGRIKFSAKGDHGQVATMELGDGSGKTPQWVIAYPGAKAQSTLTAKADSADGTGEGGMVTFTTRDTPSQVIAFYESKCKEMGMKVDMTGTTLGGGMVVATDEVGKRAMQVMVAGTSGEDTTIAITFGRKR